ncbi:GlsB/YeaQ/YmgE family stress response membrane protein [Spirosoma pollinicola]|uniref:GlsB/YeaQ/YmgE family stress response membrane protein n=1 Tax=Spirosoma pollinicola TaxID=2057025 RepID=A0A2K8Z035_9BACT|nr:GlsB/YeaQ/YmgE family stress response membrane protein [Spirosoma pollinicola]AUD03184.1 GlsB/YeaQ/YmgE family stress response membrane protein [Spirosoma pollinicola]
MGFLYSIILGGIAGYIASRLMDSHNSALVNIILGIVGGLVGGFIAKRLGNDPDNDGLFMNLLISVGGAIVLIFLGRLF